ncbi:class I adenylate-forming enzyme family protein [Streptomyces wuyuanensis]|uniref:Acyl-CoA synthetase (AMP-forming)/AMP-acid ligase II n=1 Tax=Streptomyces wuyuanensis TaxID=1196353 RepID=A0A1G9MNQ4_9ACTN|nr:class I adenylate-forming enzyme family protein [Streptomyces wuyuanensis]SDL75295.1 Acyl-CoA synthetase (AMP-forming)/AMP-acid ligase II [Streptomyces wuyuanensis]
MTSKLFTPHSETTYDEVERQALGLAEALRARGIEAGDRVTLKAGNSGGFVVVLLALMHTGVSIVLLDDLQQDAVTERVVTLARSRLTITDGANRAPAGATVSVDELLAEAAGGPSTTGHEAGELSFTAWRALPDGLITWSSGSTGEPKGIVKSGEAMLRNLDRSIERMGHRPDDVLLPLLPFSHQYGLSMLLTAWLARSSLVIAPYRRLDHAVRMAGMFGATVVDATPAVHLSILNLAERRPEMAADLRKVRMYCTGGAPLDRSAAERFVAALGLPLLDGYGSTELGNIAFATPDNPVGCGPVLPGIDVRLESGPGAEAPGIGEVMVRTPDLFSGYLGADGQVEPVSGDWYRTGDLGRFDDEGNLFVLGRKLAVHRMGYTLYPEVIERTAGGCGAPVKIVPLPDERLGSRLVFFVQDPEGRDVLYWRERICAQLSPFEYPNRVVVCGAFPLNRNGKPDNKQLRAMALAGSETPEDRSSL